MTRIGTSTPRTSIPLTELKGTAIPEGEKKVVSTASHDIQLESDYGNFKLPDFKLTRRTIEDPGARAKIIDDAALDPASLHTAAEFKTKLGELLAANKDFLAPGRQALLDSLPEGTRSNYAYLNITGRRTEQFFDEATRLLDRSGLSGAEATGARQALNFAHRDAFRGRSLDYDKADTGSYWSYGHDAPFAHVFEKMLKALPADDPKREFIQNQLDFIFTHKYVNSGSVDENSCEKSLGLTAIAKKSRHVVSMVESTAKSNRVQYETLQLSESVGGDHAGKWAFRDAGKLYFEGTRDEVPTDLVGKLVSATVDEVVFRRTKSGESQREGFRFDWNSNRMLDTKSHDTGWWGHCDIKAAMETLLADMKGSAGVSEFNSTTGETVDFSRADQLEALASLLNFDDAYALSGRSGQARLGGTDFAGGRFDDRATKFNLKTSGATLNLDVRLNRLSENGDTSKNISLDRAFATKKVDDRNESFTDNPDILRVDELDVNYIDASKRKIEGTTDGYTFNERGWPIEHKSSFVLDPTADSGDKVLIASELVDVTGHKLDRYYYDPASKQVSKVPTSFEETNGTFTAKEGTAQVVGTLKGIELGREMEGNDDIEGKLKLLEEAARTGDKMATDSSLREQVWNGEIHRIEMKTEWRSDDGKWERVGVNVDATFGSGKVGSILHKLDDEGKIIESFELKPVVDFFWKDRPRVAPLVSERGNWYINAGMANRGVIALDGDRLWTSMGAMTDLNDLIYLGLKAKDNQKLFTIVHEGKRLMYDDKAAWEADVKKLKGEDIPAPPTPGSGVQVKSTPALAIPDNDPAGVSDVIKVDADGALKSLKVDIDLAHTYVGDLTLTLTAPDGTAVALHSKSGGGSDDIRGTYGDSLTSAEALDAFKGKPIKGDWKLSIVDSAGRDVGALASWGLNIDTE
ncbi:MAG: proprotein convertase P-domain-containing protein [Pseudomonadota bacterium]